MSHCLSNVSIIHPISTQKPNPFRSRFSNLLKVRAESRDNLDHLQKTNKLQSQQPKRRSAPIAPIGLWDRFPTARTVQQMMDTMERLIEDPYLPSTTRDATVGYSRGRTPWEIKESESDYKLRFDMPGMTKQDVKVWVEEKMLVVKAEKKKSENEEENGEEWSAKSYGKYSSRIALPENVQFEKIMAEVKDGVLYITIPKGSVGAKVLDINVE
ncbi:hypothetical protein ACJIZ3_010378 [Penstemon smallii]|uniref:SHSP domain-containing protein n=1 Tax=Penstemon smallii TaxID=265156 RepID=A0ABD3TH51_9LAMI